MPWLDGLLDRTLTWWDLLDVAIVSVLVYEVLKLAAASDALWARIIRAPGLGLQYLTTREPEPAMIEVAIRAFELAINDGVLPETADTAQQSAGSEKESDPA